MSPFVTSTATAAAVVAAAMEVDGESKLVLNQIVKIIPWLKCLMVGSFVRVLSDSGYGGGYGGGYNDRGGYDDRG